MSSNRLQQLQQLQRESPNDPFLIFAIAKEYEKSGEQEQALAQYIKLREQHPDYIGTYYHLGKLYERSGQAQHALNTYKAGMAEARKAGDQHALSELAGAKLALEE